MAKIFMSMNEKNVLDGLLNVDNEIKLAKTKLENIVIILRALNQDPGQPKLINNAIKEASFAKDFTEKIETRLIRLKQMLEE